jgi:hypothetical protein
MAASRRSVARVLAQAVRSDEWIGKTVAVSGARAVERARSAAASGAAA